MVARSTPDRCVVCLSPTRGTEHFGFPPVLHNWVIKGLGMSSQFFPFFFPFYPPTLSILSNFPFYFGAIFPHKCVRVSCRPVLGGDSPPPLKKKISYSPPPPRFLLTLFLITLSPPTPRLLPPPKSPKR